MCSGSQDVHQLYVEIPFISDDDFAFEIGSRSSTTRTNPSRAEDAAPDSEPVQCPNQTNLKLRSPGSRLLHGRSPLGLATPILADDEVKDAVARPARILQLICDARRLARSVTQITRGGIPAGADWKLLKASPPSPTLPVRSRSPRARKRNTETPLARCLIKDFQMKLYRRRVVEMAVGKGLARRFDLRIRTRGI